MILGEVMREHGQEAVDLLIEELNLEEAFGFKPGTRFKSEYAQYNRNEK